MRIILSIFLFFNLFLFGHNYALGQNQFKDLQSETDPAQINRLIGKIGEQVKENLSLMFSVAFTESIRMQELKEDASAKGKPKNFVYESIVTNRAATTNSANYQPTFIRKLKSINGKPVREAFSPQDSVCEETNPQSTYENPLAFLLPQNHSKYTFSLGGTADLDGNKTIVILVTEKPISETLAIVEKDDCLFLSRPLRLKGKIWVDSNNYDVLQTQWEQAENFSAELAKKIVKRGIIPLIRPAVTIIYDRQDFTIRFRRLKFQEFEQTLLLPYFSESVWITKGMKTAGMRTAIEYAGYKLFKIDVKIDDSEQEPDPLNTSTKDKTKEREK